MGNSGNDLNDKLVNAPACRLPTTLKTFYQDLKMYDTSVNTPE
jgi:hypothetical protein